MKNHSVKQLKEYTQTLFNSTESWDIKRDTLEKIASFFSTLNAYGLQNSSDLQAGKGITLNTGHAVGTWSAAMCLLEITRTRVFLEGIIEAINTMLNKTNERPIHILDAGCGPYAILSLIPALYFSPLEVKFHLIDIIPENISSVRTIIEALGMEDYFRGIHQEDATKFIWRESSPLHIIISETMLNALRKEPQVAITLHLAPQLAPGGIFIPEEINVDLMVVDESKKNRARMDEAEYAKKENFEMKIEQLIQLTADSYKSCNQKDLIELKKVSLPDFYNQQKHCLEFYTTIKVFCNHTLQDSDCSLTLPFYFSRPYKNPIPQRSTLSFRYQISSNPGIEATIFE